MTTTAPVAASPDAAGGFLTVQEREASAEIKDKLLSYGEDVLTSKFPDAIDGLKVSTRRIVWCARNYPEPQGFSKLVGAIADVHVGGESSIIEAMIRLAQPFMVGHALIEVEGKSGEYYDPKAYAASRYLKAGIAKFARDVFFTGINLKTLPLVPTKDFSGTEPRYLIPRLPMALVLGNLTVGFGFKSDVPMIDFSAVCDLVMTFAKYYKQHGLSKPQDKVLAPYLVPTFPIANLVKNRKELIRAYSQGDFTCSIQLEGKIEISGSNLVLRAVPYGVDFGRVTNELRNRLKDRKSWLYDYIDSANQYSSDEAEFSITVKRGRNPFEVLDKIRGILRFSTCWHPLYSYLKDNRVVTLTPPYLIRMWYRERSISIAGSLKYRQADLILKKLTLEALLVVIDYIDEVISIIRHSADEVEAIAKLHARFEKLTLNQAKIIANQPLIKLTKNTRKQLESDLEQTRIDLKNTVADFNRIDDIIYNDAQYLKKKYPSEHQTRFSDEFIGYVQFGDWGVIQFFDTSDLREILNTKWPTAIVRSIHLYDARYPHRCIVKNHQIQELTDDSRAICCEDLLCYPAGEREELTLMIGKDKRTAIVEKSLDLAKGQYTLCPISRSFYAIHRKGHITVEDYKNFTIRKSVSGGTKTDLIYGLPSKMKNVVIFHMNPADPNVLHADLILRDEHDLGKLRTMVTGHIRILGIYPVETKELYINIPPECRKNSAMEFLYITNLRQLFTQETNVVINTTKNSKTCKVVRDHDVRSLYRLVVNSKD